MDIEKWILWFNLFDRLSSVAWKGAKWHDNATKKPNDAQDPRGWKIHNWATGCTVVSAMVVFSYIFWNIALNDSNFLLQILSMTCALLALEAALLFAVMQFMVWRRKAYFEPFY